MKVLLLSSENAATTQRKTLASKVIAIFLALILTLNRFIFNSKFYLQIKSFVIGTMCAHTYPNVFMSDSEERYIYPLIKNKSSSYLRFIDDVFMVWTRSENKLTSFINEINKKHHSIKFDFKFSKEKIVFVDTLVYKKHNNRLQATFASQLTCKIISKQNLDIYFHCKRVFRRVKH